MTSHAWVKSNPKPKPKHQALKDRQQEDKERIAEEHTRLRREFYERTGGPKWGMILKP